MNEKQTSEENEETECREAYHVRILVTDRDETTGELVGEPHICHARMVVGRPWLEASDIERVEQDTLSAYREHNFAKVVDTELIVPDESEPEESETPTQTALKITKDDTTEIPGEEWERVIAGSSDCKFPSKGIFFTYGESVERPGMQEFMSYTNKPGYPLAGLQKTFESVAQNTGAALEDVYLVSLHPIFDEDDEGNEEDGEE